MNQNVPTPVKASWRIVAAVAMVALAWPDMALAQRTSRSQFSSRTQPQTSTARQVPQTPRGLSRPGGPRRGDEPVVGPSGEGIEARGSFDEEGFVGRDAEDVRETFDRLSPRERRGAMFDMMLENLNEMRRAQERWQEQRRQPPPVRIRLQPAFRSPPRVPAVVAANVETRFREALTGVDAAADVELIDGVAILRGTAATARARKVAEQIAALQPGVTRVENQIVIQE